MPNLESTDNPEYHVENDEPNPFVRTFNSEETTKRNDKIFGNTKQERLENWAKFWKNYREQKQS